MSLPPDLDSLIRGQHGDPFRLLGAHVAPDGGVVVRALRPGARSGHAPAASPARRARADDAPAPRRPVRGARGGPFALSTTASTIASRSSPAMPPRTLPTIRIASAGSSATTTCTCSARACCSACTIGSARIRPRSAAWRACTSPSGRRTASACRVIGDFNQWDGRAHPMRRLVPSGIWELFIPDLGDGAHYKFEIRTDIGHLLHKTDPYGRYFEVPPRSASIVCRTEGYAWGDRVVDGIARRLGRVASRGRCRSTKCTWPRGGRVPEDDHRSLTYRELAEQLVPYVKEQGFTHIELLPVLEHPVRRIVGLSGDRLLRADQPARPPARLQVLRRRVPPRRHRRAARLGARATSRRMRTAWRASTAPRSTSTRTRGRASTRTGAR